MDVRSKDDILPNRFAIRKVEGAWIHITLINGILYGN